MAHEEMATASPKKLSHSSDPWITQITPALTAFCCKLHPLTTQPSMINQMALLTGERAEHVLQQLRFEHTSRFSGSRSKVPDTYSNFQSRFIKVAGEFSSPMYQYPSQCTADPSMSMSRIQGQPLEITVVGCHKLKDTEWISRQDPYVCVEYGSTKFRTRTCKDGGKNPTFQEKFVFTLIEGLRELNVIVWNSNTLTYDDFIGSGKVQLQKVLSQGYDDTAWSLQTKTGRYAGEVRLILHYANANKPATSFAPSAPPYLTGTPPAPQVPPYASPSPALAAPYSAVTAYPATSPYPSYPQSSAAYPPPPYPPPQSTAYPSQPYAPPAYPPPPYPPPGPGSPYYPPGPFPGIYPPPPY